MTEEQEKTIRKEIERVTPKLLYDYLNKNVIGQDRAKKTLSVAVYNHYKRFMDNLYGFSKDMKNNPYKDVIIEKSNILLAGNSGTGKTLMLRLLAKYLNIPFYLADMTSVTESGFVGDDVENVVLGALRDCDFDLNTVRFAIIGLDEIDKIARKGESTSITRDVGGEGVQQSLLKIVEGTKVAVPPNGGRKHPEQQCIEVDTSNILFVGLGAFDGIESIIERRKNCKSIGFNSPTEQVSEDKESIMSELTAEDLRKFGFIPELIGRFPVITSTNPLSEDDLYKILSEPENSVIKQYQKIMWLDNIDLKFDENALREIAHIASKQKTGARALRGIIDSVLTEIMFEYGGYHKKKKTVTITQSDIQNYENRLKLAA